MGGKSREPQSDNSPSLVALGIESAAIVVAATLCSMLADAEVADVTVIVAVASEKSFVEEEEAKSLSRRRRSSLCCPHLRVVHGYMNIFHR